ncbi:hypothetical protein LguiA_019352 [Lonicera macranthoides]
MATTLVDKVMGNFSKFDLGACCSEDINEFIENTIGDGLRVLEAHLNTLPPPPPPPSNSPSSSYGSSACSSIRNPCTFVYSSSPICSNLYTFVHSSSLPSHLLRSSFVPQDHSSSLRALLPSSSATLSLLDETEGGRIQGSKSFAQRDVWVKYFVLIA